MHNLEEIDKTVVLYKNNKIFCYDNEMKNGVFW